jgi:hypothetical protein
MSLHQVTLTPARVGTCPRVGLEETAVAGPEPGRPR